MDLVNIDSAGNAGTAFCAGIVHSCKTPVKKLRRKYQKGDMGGLYGIFKALPLFGYAPEVKQDGTLIYPRV